MSAVEVPQPEVLCTAARALGGHGGECGSWDESPFLPVMTPCLMLALHCLVPHPGTGDGVGPCPQGGLTEDRVTESEALGAVPAAMAALCSC